MSPWTYRGARVLVSPTADIPTPYRLGHEFDHVVQQVLNSTNPWHEGDDPIETASVERRLKAIVVPIADRRVIWAKHRGHHARAVHESPFVDLKRSETTEEFTIELVGSSSRPRLVRAYPGDYIPPLPWQKSAENAYDGFESTVEFWRKHAYVLTPGVIVMGTQGFKPPSWFKV